MSFFAKKRLRVSPVNLSKLSQLFCISLQRRHFVVSLGTKKIYSYATRVYYTNISSTSSCIEHFPRQAFLKSLISSKTQGWLTPKYEHEGLCNEPCSKRAFPLVAHPCKSPDTSDSIFRCDKRLSASRLQERARDFRYIRHI